jgi:hypothetical protein
VTTARFLEVFALGSLRDLPDLETLGSSAAARGERDDDIEATLDDVFGLDDQEDGKEEFDERSTESASSTLLP